MKTNKLTGFFDVRVYKKDLDRDKRPIKGQSDNITFTVASDTPIEGLKEYMVCKTKHTDSGDINRYYLQFKIGGNCRWFDGNGQPTEQPLYSNLDGKRYEVISLNPYLYGSKCVRYVADWFNGDEYEDLILICMEVSV